MRRVILRCTTRLLDLLRADESTLVDADPSDEDWYANLLWIDRRKCLLLTHAGTLFPVFIADVRARELKTIGSFVIGHIDAALADEGFARDALGVLDPASVRLARTASRQVLGFMSDFWSRYVTDVGRTGPDRGEGGKYLLLPPDYKGAVPDGYFVLPSRTYGNAIIFRGFMPG